MTPAVAYTCSLYHFSILNNYGLDYLIAMDPLHGSCFLSVTHNGSQLHTTIRNMWPDYSK